VKTLPRYLLLFLAIPLASCQSGSATVGCSNPSKLMTTMGLLNTEGEIMGNLIDLDPQSKHAAYLGSLKDFDPAKDATITPSAESTDISTDTALNISFSVNLTAAQNAALTSALTNNMQLHLENTSRHQMTVPSEVVNRAANLALIKTLLKNGHHLILIHAGNTTEKATFQLKNGTANELKLAFGGKSFDFQVNYQCQGDLNTTVSAAHAAHTLTFFKIIEVSAKPDGSLDIGDFAGNITDYDLGQAALL
jgi:hypothetical protein